MNNTLKAFLCRIGYSPVGDFFVTSLGIKRLWTEIHVYVAKKHLLAEAEKEFNKGLALGTLADYTDALKRHWVSYSEYAHQYEFYNKSEIERSEFVSRLKMAYFYWRYVPGTVKPFFRNKNIFLKKFSAFIHREWIFVPESH